MSPQKPILSPEMIDYYWDHPVEFIEHNVIVPAREFMPGIEITWQQRDLLNAISDYEKVSVESGHGCHAKNASIKMFDGSDKLVQDIVVGDMLMGDDFTPRRVLSLKRGRDEIYQVIPKEDHRYDFVQSKYSYFVNKHHVLSVLVDDLYFDLPLNIYLKLPKEIKETIKGYWRKTYNSAIFKEGVFGFRAKKVANNEDYYGFEIDRNGRYLLANGTVTHNSGKSTALSWAAFWFLTTRYNTSKRMVKIPVIAPTFHQLYDIIWPEFKRWIPLSRLASMYEYRTDEIFIKGAKDSCYIRARSPRTPDNVQGFHAEHLLWIGDEAFGITDDLVWETVDGSLTDPLSAKENKIIICGQHTAIVGYVHDTFHRDKDFWKNLRLNSEESPIADPSYCQRVARKYGKNSDVYRIRVLGTEPKGNPDSLIQMASIEQARQREVVAKGKLQMGVDCARFGDDLFVVTLAHGRKVFPQKNLPKSDTDDMEKVILGMLRAYRTETGCNNLCYIKIDNGGGYAGGLIDKLNKNRTDRIKVIPVDNAIDNDHPDYSNNISVMWGEVAELIDELELPHDEDSDFLAEELAARTFDHDGSDRIKLSSKKKFKDIYHASPDRADSLVLCLSESVEPKRIFPSYLQTDSNFKRDFEIDWKNINPVDAQIAVVLIGEKNFGISGSIFMWGRKSRKLRVYGEIFHLNPVASVIAHDIKSKLQIPIKTNNSTEICCNAMYCNTELMKGGKDTVAMLRKYGIRLKEAKQYDQAGSIMLANHMFQNHQVIVHDSLNETSRQYTSWKLKKNIPEKGYPSCEALCIFSSILKEDGELYTAPPEKAYSKKKKYVRDKLYADHKEGDRIATKSTRERSEWDFLI